MPKMKPAKSWSQQLERPDTVQNISQSEQFIVSSTLPGSAKKIWRKMIKKWKIDGKNKIKLQSDLTSWTFSYFFSS